MPKEESASTVSLENSTVRIANIVNESNRCCITQEQIDTALKKDYGKNGEIGKVEKWKICSQEN